MLQQASSRATSSMKKNRGKNAEVQQKEQRKKLKKRN